MFSPPVPCRSTFSATVPASGFRATVIGSSAGLRAVPPQGPLCDFGKPLLPVGKATPLRTATNAPVGTRKHHTLPV